MKLHERLAPARFAGEDIVLAAERSLRSACGIQPSAQDVTEILLNNQVPLLSLAESTSTITHSQPFKDALAGEQIRFAEAHGHFAEFASRLEARGIDCICFKSAGIEPSFAYTSENYDILFRQRDEQGARATLEELGYAELRNIEEHQKWLFRLFVGGRSASAIHVHTRVGWGQGFMIEDEIWKRSRVSSDDSVTRIPGPEDAVLINTAHSFYENKAFGLHDLMKLRHAIQRGVDWEYIDHVARHRGWLGGLHFGLAMVGSLESRLFDAPSLDAERVRIVEATCRGKRMTAQVARANTAPLQMPFHTSWVLSKSMYFDKLARDQSVPVTAKPAMAVVALSRGIKGQLNAHPQNSALFSLSGVDGCGKTRQANALVGVFTIAELRARTRWARVGATPIMARASRLWRRKPAQAYASRTVSNHRSPRTARRGSLAQSSWAIAAACDFAIWSLGLRWRLLRGDIIFADRYLCDLDVELTLKLPNQRRLHRSLVTVLKAVAPRPRHAFLLDISATEAFERALPDSDEFDPVAAIDLYHAKAATYGLDIVSAASSFEDVSATLARKSLQAYMKRYGMLGNLIYFANPWQLNRPARSWSVLSATEATARAA